MREHFDKLKREPERGTIHVGDERYVLVRGSSLTTAFLEVMRDVIGEVEALKFWYRIARVIGQQDAKSFCEIRGLTDGPARLSTGPVHFAFSGWARVEIADTSRPASDDTYYLEYTHPNTFESESWVKSGQKASQPICVFSAGYSAGWCSEAFGISVDAREVYCVGAGHSECRFVMAPFLKLEEHERALKERSGG